MHKLNLSAENRRAVFLRKKMKKSLIFRRNGGKLPEKHSDSGGIAD